MSEQSLLDINLFNKVMRELNKYFTLKYLPPLYNDDYIQFELHKEIMNNPNPTIITIKSNGRITFTVDRKINIPNISATQSEYTGTGNYKGCLRISCGHKSIDTFFTELGSDIASYL